MRTFLLLILIFLIGQFDSSAQSDFIRQSGDVLQVVFPVLTIGSTFAFNDDSNPKLQLLKTGIVAFGLTHSLKRIINKERPDGGDHAFPSGHTSSTFMGAAFLERRFGWKVGIPAYLLAGYTGWSRIHAKKHDGWDVFAGAIIGMGSAYLFTKPYMKDIDVEVSVVDDGISLGLSLQF
jgi:membrane-associated phospholipid phosphatase